MKFWAIAYQFQNDVQVPVPIELETLNKNGVWSYTRGKVERWDED